MTRTPYIAEWKTQLQKYQDCVAHVYTFRTHEEFDRLEDYLIEYELTPPQDMTVMETIVPNQRKLLFGTATVENTIQINEEAFWPQEVIVTPVTPVTPVVTTIMQNTWDSHIMQDSHPEPIVLPKIIIEETKPRKRDTKSPVVATSTNSITLHRTIKLPIEWVQFSNNEFGVSVTAGTAEEATEQLTTLLDKFMNESGLTLTSKVKTLEEIAFKNWQASAKQTPVQVPVEKIVYKRSPEDELELKRYARVQEFMTLLSKDTTILPVMKAIKAQFEASNPKF